MSDGPELRLHGLDQLLKALKAREPTARIGILGSGQRAGKGSPPSNATIGAWHEFGTSKMPMRSFLRVPLTDHLNDRLASAGAFDPETLKAVIASGSLIPWIKKVMIVAKVIVLEGFDTGGFGKWPDLAQSTWSKKKVQQILVETQQLRNSITTEVSA